MVGYKRFETELDTYEEVRLPEAHTVKTYNDGRALIKSEVAGNGTNLSCGCSPLSSEGCSVCRGRSFRRQGNGSNLSMTITVHDSGEHCHDNELRHEIDQKARKKLWLASILCVIFMLGEAIGGALAGSLAVATDAAHLLTDFAGFMISLFALYISERPATKRLSYGYHRAEVIGALTSVLLIWVVTGILVYLAVDRCLNQDFEIDAKIMLITSGIGVIINIIMGCTLHQHSHSHGGGCSSSQNSHSHSSEQQPNGQACQNGGINGKPEKKLVEGQMNGGFTGSKDDLEAGVHTNSQEESDGSYCSSSNPASVSKQNINVRAAFIHVLGDFIQSVGVFIAALVIYFKPTWVIVDPICTFMFSILVLGTTYAIIKDALVVLMEGIPKGIDFNEVKKTLLDVKGVKIVHNLRIWSLSMDKIAMSAHLAIDRECCNANSILRKSSQLVKHRYGFCEVTIQIEDFNQSMQDCLKCQELN